MAKKAAKTKGSAPKVAKTKMAAIVEVATANPDMPVKDAVAKIKAEYGLDVTEAYYQTAKSQAKAKAQARQGKRVQRNGTSSAAQRETTTVDNLLSAKNFVSNVGGFEQARNLLKVLEEINLA